MIKPRHDLTNAMQPTHVYEVRPRKDKRGVDLISDALPFGRLRHGSVSDAIGYPTFRSRSHDAVIRFTMRRAILSERMSRRPFGGPVSIRAGDATVQESSKHCR